MKTGIDSDAIPFANSFKYIATMGALYLIGLVIYIYRIPECWFSEKYKNLWRNFNSHVIWHLFVFFAAVTHAFASFELYRARMSVTCLDPSTTA